MIANEVRINNWVEFEGKHYRIDSVAKIFPTLDSTEFGIGVVDWNNLKPIPLTEECLLKFGFEIKKGLPSGSSHVYCDFEHGMNDYRIYISEPSSLIGCTLHLRNNPEWYPKIAEFRFIHELQNIHYCLFGEELELKTT